MVGEYLFDYEVPGILIQTKSNSFFLFYKVRTNERIIESEENLICDDAVLLWIIVHQFMVLASLINSVQRLRKRSLMTNRNSGIPIGLKVPTGNTTDCTFPKSSSALTKVNGEKLQPTGTFVIITFLFVLTH